MFVVTIVVIVLILNARVNIPRAPIISPHIQIKRPINIGNAIIRRVPPIIPPNIIIVRLKRYPKLPIPKRLFQLTYVPIKFIAVIVLRNTKNHDYLT